MDKEAVIKLRDTLKQGKNLPLNVFIDNAFMNINEADTTRFTKWDDENGILYQWMLPTPHMQENHRQQAVTVFAVSYDYIEAMQISLLPVSKLESCIDTINDSGSTPISDDFKNLIINSYKKLTDPNNIIEDPTEFNNFISSHRRDSNSPNAISEVKEVMNSITQSSQEQSNQMVAKLTDATEKLGSFLDSTIINLSSSVQNSMKSITDDVNSKQADLLALQEDTTSQTKKLLEAFNSGLDRLEKMNEYVTDTMNSFKQAQGEISISTGNLRTISGDMKLATELFNKGQSDYTEKLNQLQLSSQRGIDQVAEMLKNSGQMTDEYAQKFEVIKQGLSGIFSQLQTGLTEYSRTVQATTQKYLDQYTTNLTQTTDALSSTIQQQNEVVEMLNEILSRKK